MEHQAQTPRLLEQVRNYMRLHHYSIHTERTYIEWITRYVQFHHMKSREDLGGAESKIEAFSTDLAVNGKVAPAMFSPPLVHLRRQLLLELRIPQAPPALNLSTLRSGLLRRTG